MSSKIWQRFLKFYIYGSKKKLPDICQTALVKYLKSELFSENAYTEKQQDEKQDWRYELNHNRVEDFSAESFAIFADFVGDCLRFCDPSNQNTSEEGNQRHQNVITCVVKDVQKLAD